MSSSNNEASSLLRHKVYVEGEIPTLLKNQIQTIVDTCQSVFDGACVVLSFYDTKFRLFSAPPTLKASIENLTPLLNQTAEQEALFISDELDGDIQINSVKAEFYAGIALRCSCGEPLGVLSLLDTKTCDFDKTQIQLLRTFSQSIVDKLELNNRKIELQELEEFSELIINTNQDYIFVKDEEYRVVKANPAFIELHPESMRDNLIGSTSFEEYEPDEVEVFLKHDKIAFKDGRSEVNEVITLPNGVVRLLHTTKTRFENSKGEKYILGVARDVSEREELLADLRKSNQDLDEFAYIASHDLKAPLTAIKRLVSWIEEDAGESLDEDSKKHFGMIKNRVNRMSNLLSDLLSYSRIGREEHAPVELSLRDSVSNCFDLLDIPEGFSIVADDAQLKLPRVPFELVLTNLISNAIKHHDKSQGRIDVTYEDRGEDYQVIVSDDGPGINPSMHEKIFERFQTLKPRDDVEGSGLGLAMVLKTIQYLGGSINVDSSEGQGAKFIITLPRQ